MIRMWPSRDFDPNIHIDFEKGMAQFVRSSFHSMSSTTCNTKQPCFYFDSHYQPRANTDTIKARTTVSLLILWTAAKCRATFVRRVVASALDARVNWKQQTAIRTASGSSICHLGGETTTRGFAVLAGLQTHLSPTCLPAALVPCRSRTVAGSTAQRTRPISYGAHMIRSQISAVADRPAIET